MKSQYESWDDIFLAVQMSLGVGRSGPWQKLSASTRRLALKQSEKAAYVITGSGSLGIRLRKWVSRHFDVVMALQKDEDALANTIADLRKQTDELAWHLALSMAPEETKTVKTALAEKLLGTVDVYLRLLAAKVERDTETVRSETRSLRFAWERMGRYAVEWLLEPSARKGT